MEFAPKPGCPMCGIVARAARDADPDELPSPRSPQAGPPADVLYRDDNFTAYRERTHPVASQGHVVIAFNLHVPSLYALSSSDVPLLTSLKPLASRLLAQVQAATPPVRAGARAGDGTPTPTVRAFALPPALALPAGAAWSLGFIAPPLTDPKIPVGDHLHAHAFLGPADNARWWRALAYSSVGWYALDDLVAEIRESTSNNRIRSGHAGRADAPIDRVPLAGARAGTSFGYETTEAGVGSSELDAREQPRALSPNVSLTPDTPRGTSFASPGAGPSRAGPSSAGPSSTAPWSAISGPSSPRSNSTLSPPPRF